ncbi:nitrate ABC transporter substrate-binding protein, partial [Rhizobium ruizarguesonis]
MSHFMMNRRRFIYNVATVGGLAAEQTLIGVRAGLAEDVAQVKMQLGWLDSNGVIGEVAAQKKGF